MVRRGYLNWERILKMDYWDDCPFHERRGIVRAGKKAEAEDSSVA
jgi:hypothetical protein